MANFDSNQWYHIYYNQNKKTALMGSELYNTTTHTGTSFFKTAKTSDADQQWQFYAIDSDFYALRTRDSGSDGFLGTAYSANEDTPGNTVPRMVRGDISDDSVFWKVTPWGDGTFYLSNKENKTSWHLTRKANSLGAMTSNITGDKPFQQFSFDTISAINDDQFSTVNLPTTTKSSAASSTSTDSATGTPNSPASGQSSGGLSTGAKAGIGAGVGIVALIALVVLGLFLWRRRRRNQQSQGHTIIEGDKYNAESSSAPAYEMPQLGAVKYEAYGTPQAELHNESQPAELPGEIPGHNVR
ncbi:hypothetical protein N0V90_007802 [Kalmusia sp. IMI 367209]|nr:hypothetical protein N0V90_007802 [Kalmusia sp. IMI 367209]